MSVTNGKDFLGVIVARGGSKSMPYKNIYPLGGKPLLVWSMEAARCANTISRLICSTEDSKIADVCKEYGLDVLLRPVHLAQDTTHPYPVLLDVLTQLRENESYVPFGVFLIQPTSPFVRPEQFDMAAQLLLKNPSYASIQSITPVPHNAHAYNQRSFINGAIEFVFRNERDKCHNKQLKPAFYTWGNIFLIRVSELLAQESVFATPTGGFVVNAFDSMDVDGPEDFIRAEQLLSLQ